MAASELQVGTLELAARGVDLTTALLTATTSSGSLLKGAWEIGQWLGREKLNQYELLDCMEKAKGLVVANRNGQQFFDEIICGLETLTVRPLFLQQSGSLGRLMAGDPNLSWIVSTVGCLFQQHSDDRIVTEALTSFIMESHRSRGQERRLPTVDSLIYNPEQTRVRAVVRKIVSSVWYNVVNVGCDTIPLPHELHSICSTGHYLEPGDFGIVINTIYAHCPSKAILRTDHLLRDVLLWLILHYDGTIIVNAGGQIVYRADLGNPHRELEVRVASVCSEDDGCRLVGKETYTILRHISGRFEEFFSGHSISGFTESPPRPGIRQKLYEIPRIYPSDSPMWNKGLQILMKCSAQSVMRWLLSVPLSAQANFSSPGFSAEPEQQATASHETVSSVFTRVPSMINLQWGSSPASQVVFRGGTPDVVRFGHIDGEFRQDIEPRLNTLLECFPVLADLVTKVSADCLCLDCSRSDHQHGSVVGSNRLRPGCLKRMALEETFLLLAHGVADGFAVNDTSSVSDMAPIVKGMTTLLLELVLSRKVSWDTWFAVASCVYLGCPFAQPVPDAHPAFGGTAFAAIQYGNLAAQAPWLDLTQDIAVRGCFGLVGSRGRLGVITRNNDQHAQFRSVEENFAIIETENTEDTTSFSSRCEKAASLVDHHFHAEEDESSVDSDVILCQMDEKFYRLFLRIKTRSHWRIVDPSDALSAVIRILPSISCQHSGTSRKISPRTAKIYTMDELLGRWPDTIQRHVSTTTASRDETQNSGTFHVTNIFKSHFKKNIALALSVCPVAVLNSPDTACSTCTLNHAREADREPLRDGESGNPADRYIINLSTQLAEQGGGIRHRLIEART